MTVRTLVYLVIAMIIVNVAALGTMAYQHFSRPDRPRMFNQDRDRDRGQRPDFQLSDEERDAMEHARADFESNVKPLLDSLGNVRKALFSELRLDQPDSSIINAAIEEQGVLQTKIQKRLIDRFLADRDLIQPEHRERLLQGIEQRTSGGRFWGHGRFGNDDRGPGSRRGH